MKRVSSPPKASSNDLEFREPMMRVLIALWLLSATQVIADTGNINAWSISHGCPHRGPAGRGAFHARQWDYFTAMGRKGCARTPTRFTLLYFSSFMGSDAPKATLFNETTRRYEIFSLDINDILVTPPIKSTEQQPIFTVSPLCPAASATVNWITSQWTISETTNLQNTYLLGTATIAGTTGALTITGQYDVSGNAYWTGAVPMNVGACSNGLATATGSGNLDGTFYYKSDGGGVYKSSSGRAFFMLPQIAVEDSAFASKTFQGIQFNSISSDSVRHIRVISDLTGKVFTIKPYSSVLSGAVGADFTDTLTVKSANTPHAGMMIGTLIRTTEFGSSGPVKIGCIANKHVTKGYRVICSGQSPAKSTLPYNITFTNEADSNTACPKNYILVAANPEVGVKSDFCIAKYEMKEVKGLPASQPTGRPWVSKTQTNATLLCRELGAGYDLITNAEWQTVAREIEIAQDINGNYLNWSQGSILGNNAINRGHSDDAPNNTLAASTDSNPCYGTQNIKCADNNHPDFTQKRTYRLTSDDVIWDFAGNAQEWIKDSNSTAQGTNGFLSVKKWDGTQDPRETATTKLKWGPSGTYTAKANGNYGGLGYGHLNYSTGAVVRGGFWKLATSSGVFAANLGFSQSAVNNTVGFRCVYHP
ncbi:MAG: hypothetical protein HY537_04175 [Deltaproteobacteria bacterium]|nr:hypothetical protein [Deltaproteobacteria bacterium]